MIISEFTIVDSYLRLSPLTSFPVISFPLFPIFPFPFSLPSLYHSFTLQIVERGLSLHFMIRKNFLEKLFTAMKVTQTQTEFSIDGQLADETWEAKEFSIKG